MMEDKKKVYVVLTNTGTLTSKVLRWFTKSEYNHSSISLEDSLPNTYSFARRWTYYPFYGGFVRENPLLGVFGRFPKTKAVVIELGATQKQYEGLRMRLMEMYQHRKKYRYDWLGIFLSLFHKKHKRTYHYYCSEFVKEMLVSFGMAQEKDFPYIIKPHHFLEIFRDKIIYQDLWKNFRLEEEAAAPLAV